MILEKPASTSHTKAAPTRGGFFYVCVIFSDCILILETQHFGWRAAFEDIVDYIHRVTGVHTHFTIAITIANIGHWLGAVVKNIFIDINSIADIDAAFCYYIR